MDCRIVDKVLLLKRRLYHPLAASSWNSAPVGLFTPVGFGGGENKLEQRRKDIYPSTLPVAGGGIQTMLGL